MRATSFLLLLCASGCYQMHGSDAPRADSGVRRDAGTFVPDAFVLRDGAVEDGAAPDAGSGPCARFGVLDRLTLDWADDCGEIHSPRAEARASGFDVVVSERRSCRDRPPFIWASHLSTAGRALGVASSTTLPGVSGLESALGTNGDVLAVCSGLEFWGLDTDYRILSSGRLAEDPVGGPGCPVANRCTGAAGAEAGYLVSFEFFECDVVGHMLAIYDATGTLRGMPSIVWEPLRDVAPFDGGWAAVSSPRGFPRSQAKVFRWPTAADAPEELTIDVEGVDGALTRWPFAAGHLLTAFVDQEASGIVMSLVLLDARGREVSRWRVEPFAGTDTTSFGAARVRLATTGFGVVAATSVEWEGGALRSLSSVLAIGVDGAPLGPPHVEALEGRLGEVALAGEGDQALLHIGASIRSQSTEAILFGCR